jgi:hypothetical protein
MREIRYCGEKFDRYVGLLLRRWESALRMSNRWSTINRDERASYTEDWPVNNDIHQDLAEYAAGHELTKQQQAQWDKLNGLVAKHKADLEEMGYRVRLPDVGKRRRREVA